MEDRCSIHDHRNSVIGPHPSDENRQRRRGKAAMGDERKIMPVEKKICAANYCVWCGNGFKKAMVICPFCRSCQYCGLFSDTLLFCRFCGNQPTDEMKPEIGRRRSIKVA